MVAQPIPVAPGVFQAERQEPARVLNLSERIRSAAERVSVPTGPGMPSPIADILVQCLLTVEAGDEQVSLTLPMRSVPIDPPNIYYLETPGTVRGIKLAMRVSATGQGNLQLQTDYTGLETGRILSYARFANALRREEGKFTVSAYVGPIPRHLVTIELPLPFTEADRERSRQELRFWEAVHELSKATATKLVCPPEITEEDLRNINVVLVAVRKGWVVERVKDFTIPPAQETAENLVRIVEQEGTVFRALALVTEHESYKVFGAEIDLGTCIRHVAKAQLLTPLNQIHDWIASDPTQRGPLKTKWEPVDGSPLILLFPEWPKPTPDMVRLGSEASEDEPEDLTFDASSVPLHADADGAVRVGGTRVTLDSLAAAFDEGETPEGLLQRYPTLDVDEVYLLLGWYLRYRDRVGAYLARREEEATRLREEMEKRFDPAGLRARLLARGEHGSDAPGRSPD
jgi:uncharacterized protein (DUF433 family)